MAEFTEARVTEAVENIKSAFADGFQLEDVSILLKEVTAFAELFNLRSEEKKALALRVAERVLAETDIPVLPDKLSLPFVGEVGADALIMRFLPKLIDLVVSATKGELPVNS